MEDLNHTVLELDYIIVNFISAVTDTEKGVLGKQRRKKSLGNK